MNEKDDYKVPAVGTLVQWKAYPPYVIGIITRPTYQVASHIAKQIKVIANGSKSCPIGSNCEYNYQNCSNWKIIEGKR